MPIRHNEFEKRTCGNVYFTILFHENDPYPVITVLSVNLSFINTKSICNIVQVNFPHQHSIGMINKNPLPINREIFPMTSLHPSTRRIKSFDLFNT